MTIPVSVWITLIAGAVVIVEMIVATILYLKLCKKKERSKNETLYAAAGAAVAVSFCEPLFIVCSVLLIMEAIGYLWLIIHFIRLLKAKDETEQSPAEPLATPEPEPEPKPEPEPEPEPEPQPAEIDETAPVAEVQELVRDTITITEAHDALTDDFALHLIEEAPVVAAVVTAADDDEDKNYKSKTIINVDTLSENYQNGEHVNLETMKEKGLIPKKTDFVKVLGRGVLDKHLIVEAQDFSADAVKMIVLTGGHAIHKK